jgi:hypothetical protein
MDAPLSVSLIVTLCPAATDPPFGAIVGVGVVTVNVADATLLLGLPAATAIALRVSFVDTVIGPVYKAELAVGVDPSVV